MYLMVINCDWRHTLGLEIEFLLLGALWSCSVGEKFKLATTTTFSDSKVDKSKQKLYNFKLGPPALN